MKSSPFTILLLSTDRERSRELGEELRRAGYTQTLVCPPEQGQRLLAERHPDLVIVDVDGEGGAMLGGGGLAGSGVIALIPEEHLAHWDGLSAADDFVVKPCRPQEVVARVRHLLWRKGRIDGEQRLRCGDLIIDLARYRVTVAGRPVNLTFKEYELLRFLAANPGKAFTREVLLNKIWGYDYFGGTRTLDVHMRRLRSKIEDREHTFIETVRNVGYRFKA